MTPNNYKDQFTPEQAIKGVIAGIYAYWPTEEVDSMVDMMELVLAELAPAPVRHKDQFTEWLEKRIAKHEADLATCPGELTERRVRACMAEAVRILEQYRQLAPTWIPVTPETMPTYYQPVLCVNDKGIRYIAWLATDGEEYYWTMFDDDKMETPVFWMPLPSPPTNKEQ